MTKIQSGELPREYTPTVFDNWEVPLEIEGQNIILKLWDTAGQEEFDKLRPGSYGETDAFLICFSTSSTTSLNNVKKWKDEITKHCPNIPFVVCGTTLEPKVVDIEDAFETVKALGAFAFIECHLNNISSVSEVFKQVGSCILFQDREIRCILFEDPEIQIRRGIEAMINSEITGPCNRSKLVVVGEGRAGKTSTVKSLMSLPFDEHQASTRGFVVDRVDTYDWKEANAKPIVKQMKAVWNSNFAANETKFIDIPAAEMPEPDHSETNSSTNKLVPDKEYMIQYSKEFVSLSDNDNALGLMIWDFGGQKVFYTQHHLFLTRYTCYTVVFDIRRLFSSEEKKTESLLYLNFWMKSIKLHAPRAPIILIGTHADKLNAESEISDPMIYCIMKF